MALLIAKDLEKTANNFFANPQADFQVFAQAFKTIIHRSNQDNEGLNAHRKLKN